MIRLKKTLTLREAWKKIKKEFEILAKTGKRTEFNATGLCLACRELLMFELISDQQYYEMLMQIDTIKGYCINDSLYYWPCNKAGAAERVKAIDRILQETNLI